MERTINTSRICLEYPMARGHIWDQCRQFYAVYS